MSQEMNKKAVADLFSLEDSRAVCEAIGGLGLNPNDAATDEPLDYTPDNILDVTVNENPDGMPAFPQLGQEEMDSETQAFVVDELAKQLQADGRESHRRGPHPVHGEDQGRKPHFAGPDFLP